MAGLKEAFEKLGFQDVRTLLQSGNVVFRGGKATEVGLERELAKRFGHQVDVVLRTAEELAEVTAKNPYPKEAANAPGLLAVLFLKSVPASTESFLSALTGPEYGQVRGKHAYVFYPEGMGRSRVPNTVLEKKLGVRATARNWNTVQKLAAMTRS